MPRFSSPIPSRLESLRNQLVIAIGIVVSLFALVQGASSYHFSVTGTAALLDRRIESLAIRLRIDFDDGTMTFLRYTNPNTHDLVIAVWKNGSTLPDFTTDSSVLLPNDAPLGFTTTVIAGEKWRLYTRRRPDQLVQIAQRVSVRDAIERRAATRTLWPVVVLIPLVWLVIFIVVNRSLRKLKLLGDKVQAIDANHLQALPLAGVPTELLPFIRSINLMIERLAHAIDTERQFIADAAHELRSPLTALQLQTHNLQHEIAPENLERLRELQGGIARSSKLLSQLLQLARADASANQESMSQPTAHVEVDRVIVSVVTDVLPIAMLRNIDIGADTMSGLRLHALELDIYTIIKNLVENAVRHTPDGGKIDISTHVRDSTLDIVIADNGPGIDEAVLPRVFDRFFRGNSDSEGSGLGLAIVKAIVKRYAGTVELRNCGSGKSGIIATVSLPTEPGGVA